MDKLWAANVRGAVTCARAASRSMMRARWGRIVFMSSVVAEMGNAGQTAYAATKAALLGVAKSIAREYGVARRHGQRRRSRIHRHRHDCGNDGRAKRAASPGHPSRANGGCFGRRGGLRLSRQRVAGYVTEGQVLRVNGGMYA